MEVSRLSDDQRLALLDQLVDSYAEEQTAYDASIRTLAAAGAALTVSLAAALDELTRAGAWAVGLFLISLAINLLSYQTSQRDLRARISGCVKERSQSWTAVVG